MFSRLCPLWVALLIFTASPLPIVRCEAADKPPVVGGTIPDLNFPVPQAREEQHYLGLTDGNSFAIPQIPARVVVIEIFNMYCPFCQREAPNINRLYQLIESNGALKGKIKIMGIGAGNSAFEVNTFKRKYDVPFPLFTDEAYKIHKAWGEVRTPYFVAISIDSGGSHRVIYSKVGGIGDPQDFLGALMKSAQLK